MKHLAFIYTKMSKQLKFVIVLLIFSSSTLFSQKNSGEDKTLSPYFLVQSENSETGQLPLKNTMANVNIVGVIADVTINQTYKNEGNGAIEAIYTFPASTNAAVYAMEMKIGNRTIIAKIEEKNKARQQYNQAKSEGKRTSLLEQQRPNVFQMNVANIMPGDEIQVSLKYTEILILENGKYEFVYPTVVGPRYSEKSSTGASSSDNFLQTPYQKSGDAPFYNFNINVSLSAGMPIQNILCKTHKTNIKYIQSSLADINLDNSENAAGNRDFVLEYSLAGDQIESGLMLYEHEDENFFMLMVQPPKKIIKEEIPPREYIFIVDVSGSMRGFPVSVTKKLIRNLVVNLRPTDKFNIMVFAGTSGWMAEESLPANIANIDKAVSFIDNQRGSGSTKLLPAMQKALKFPRTDESVSRSFIVVTDGYISVEKQVFDLIRNNCSNANVFTFGIGSSVNRHLIEGMAHVGFGEPLIVLNEIEANNEAEKFRNYISNPVLTQVKKVISGLDAYDVEPISIPDVLAERPVIIYGKYKGDLKGTITIKGRTGKKAYKKTFNVSDAKPSDKNSAIRYLWARKRIQLLDDYNNLSHSDSRVKEVTALGLKYNLMTAYTSFLAIDENAVNDENIKTVKQALPLPQGVPNSAVGFEMEIEEEILDFFFHKDVIIHTKLNRTTKELVALEIEGNFISQINGYVSNYIEFINSITVTIDKNGQVKLVDIKSTNLSSQTKNRLMDQIMKAGFGHYNLGSELEFTITF